MTSIPIIAWCRQAAVTISMNGVQVPQSHTMSLAISRPQWVKSARVLNWYLRTDIIILRPPSCCSGFPSDVAGVWCWRSPWDGAVLNSTAGLGTSSLLWYQRPPCSDTLRVCNYKWALGYHYKHVGGLLLTDSFIVWILLHHKDFLILLWSFSQIVMYTHA